MSDNKKYYYLKLKENYFDRDNVKVLESMENGHLYSLIILKLYLKSLKNEGHLKMTDKIPYSLDKVNVLAKVINHDLDHVKQAINYAVELDLISLMDTKELWMTDIQNFIGHTSTEADRIREYRKSLTTEVSTNVQQKNDISTPEKELKKELKKELELKSFDKFWTLYDKKVNRDKCFNKWKKIKTDIHDSIFDHTDKYIKSTPDKKFRKNPLTYLNNECWNDEIVDYNQTETKDLSHKEKMKAAGFDYE